jgi:hypothetical protein
MYKAVVVPGAHVLFGKTPQTQTNLETVRTYFTLCCRRPSSRKQTRIASLFSTRTYVPTELKKQQATQEQGGGGGGDLEARLGSKGLALTRNWSDISGFRPAIRGHGRRHHALQIEMGFALPKQQGD